MHIYVEKLTIIIRVIRMSEKDEYEAWKREREKERVLDLINKKGTLDVSQVSDILDKPTKEIEPIVAQLTDEKLIKSEIGNYYHLTFEGERRIRIIRERKEKSSYSQQR